MPLSMFQASVPVFTRMLQALSACIDRATDSATKGDYNPSELPAMRLRPDMMPFAQQVQVATNHATGAPARLAGMEPPSLGDNERTLAELKARIGRALSFLETITPNQIDGTEDLEIVLPKRSRIPHLELAGIQFTGQDPYPMTFKGRDYLLGFAMPNFYFHITTAYIILRHAGADIGKMDYLGKIPRHDFS